MEASRGLVRSWLKGPTVPLLEVEGIGWAGHVCRTVNGTGDSVAYFNNILEGNVLLIQACTAS